MRGSIGADRFQPESSTYASRLITLANQWTVDDEGRDLRPRQHAGPRAREPAAGAAAVRRGAGLDGRNLKHLITLLEDLQALGVAFVSLAEGIDATTPAVRARIQPELERERSESGSWRPQRPGCKASGSADLAPRFPSTRSSGSAIFS